MLRTSDAPVLPRSFEICPVCFCEDDPVQLLDPTYRGRANGPSLMECQANYGRSGASEERMLAHVRLPTESAKCLGCKSEVVTGQPDPKHISTSYVERQSLTMRMSMRRFTRLTNAFSQKIENHAAAVALYFMYYNFGRVHQTLRVDPSDGGWR